MTNFLVLLLLVAAGSRLAFIGQRRFRSIALAASAGPAIGLGCMFLVTFFILFTGLDLNVVSVAVGLTLIFTLARAILRPVPPSTREDPGITDDSRPVPRCIVNAAVVVTAGAVSIAAYFWIQSAPYGTTDAVGFWTSRGLFLNRVEDDIPLRLSLMKKGKPSYPLLLPASLAGQFKLAGNENLATPQLVAVALAAAVLLLVWSITYRFGGPLRAALAVLVTGSTPVLWRWAFMQCADVLLAYLFLLSAAGLFSLVMEKETSLFSPFLTGFFLSLLFSAKVEGHAAALLLIGIAVACAALAGRAAEFARFRAPGLMAGMLPGCAATVLFKTVWCRDVAIPTFIRSDFLSTITDFQRWTHTAQAMFANFARIESVKLWGWLWLLVAAVLMARIVGMFQGDRLELSPQVFFFVACAGMIAAYGSAYVLTPYDLDWQITKSVDRLFLQLLPTVAVAAILAIGSRRSLSL